jgi:hypothetical protein
MSLTRAISTALLIVLFFRGPSAHPSEHAYSLEQLDGAANLLLSVIDGEPASRVCGIKPEEASVMIESLHARIDEGVSRYIASRKKNAQPLEGAAWERNCRSSCHCGIYASILEQAGQNAEAFERLARKQRVEACLATEQWFCESPLLKSLRQSLVDLE